MSQASFAQSVKIKVFDSKNNGLENVVVYLQPPKGMVVGMSNNTVEITQIDKSFSPYIGVMQKERVLSFIIKTISLIIYILLLAKTNLPLRLVPDKNA